MQPGDSPNAMNATHYAQRASAGLIVTETAQTSPQGKGYSFASGIYSSEQVAGWRLASEAVHAAGAGSSIPIWLHALWGKLPCSAPDRDTFFGGGVQGYTDYPVTAATPYPMER
ncbi:hypothetical protein [Acetobacter sp. DsW_063]|uniref:oxidoreductase n=1 Tax=Acetobacter sp. DsW_063 TaxID=1514894 RepID=UPI0035177F3B